LRLASQGKRIGSLAVPLVAIVLLAIVTPAEAAFPGANGSIAFVRTPWPPPANIPNVWVMNPDGSGQVNLTNESAGGAGSPRWRPDGQKIAFYSFRGGATASEYLMNADGSAVTPLGGPLFDSWSPDGERIAYSRLASPPPDPICGQPQQEIFTSNPDAAANGASPSTPVLPTTTQPGRPTDGSSPSSATKSSSTGTHARSSTRRSTRSALMGAGKPN
jgi:dipeptidyl aminopeptidase/acylaminoacyl peptidase